MGPAAVLMLLILLTLPNPAVTPGAVRPLTRAQVCAIHWRSDRRHVTIAMKRQVATNYGVAIADITPRGQGPCCEVDHLVPRALGGADVVANLWLQPWADAVVKDAVETRLHRAVCAPSSTLSLAAAQDQMRRWGRP